MGWPSLKEFTTFPWCQWKKKDLLALVIEVYVWKQTEMPGMKAYNCKMHENLETAKGSLKAQGGSVYI